MPYIITRANENNKVGKMGKGRKISHVQTIVVSGDEHLFTKIISNKLIQQVVNTLS